MAEERKIWSMETNYLDIAKPCSVKNWISMKRAF
jgi:hypothetical protein